MVHLAGWLAGHAAAGLSNSPSSALQLNLRRRCALRCNHTPQMPLAWLELLTKVHLEAVALNMGLGDGAISQSRRLAGLLHNTGAQYNHLPPEAKPVISVAAILLGKGAAQGGATGPSARPRFGTPPPQERQWARPASSDAPVPLVLGNAPISSALSTHAPLTAEQVQQRIAQLEAEIEQLRARLPTGGRDAEPVPSAAAAAAPPVGSRSTEPVTSNASAAPPVAAAAPATSAAAGQLGRDTASSTRRRRLLARLWRAPSSNVPQRRLQQLSDGDMSMLCRYGLKKHVRTQLEHGTSIKVGGGCKGWFRRTHSFPPCAAKRHQH